MVTNVTSLLKTVKSVDDEATRGSRALESSIQANNQCIKTYLSTAYIELKVTPESLIRLTKPLTTATSKAVLAGNSAKQQDAITAANAGRKAISDLLPACKSVAQSADNDQTRERMMSAGQFTTEAYQDLLEHVNLIVQRPSTSKQKLVVLSQQVAQGVTKIVQAAETIKGTDWVDPEDPAVIAEAELLGAAAKIEAAARKLESLKARAKQSKKADDTLTFDDQILEAAKSITSATAALVKAAHLAQKELVAQGRMSSMTATDLEDCSQWSEGLVSAAHLVVAATHSLCDAANLMVQGKGNEEKLISAAKQVASSTAHLLVACRVKADMHSVAMQNLQIAGNAVKRATDSLVKAAQTMNNTWSTEDTDFSVDLRMVGGLAEIIKAKEAILIKERELESARRKLETIRRAKYKGNQSEDDEEDGSAF